MEVLDDNSYTSLRVFPNTKRARTAILFMYLAIGIGGVILVAQWGYLNVLVRVNEGLGLTQEDQSRSELILGLLGLIQFPILIGGIITFLNWFRRAYANLHRIGRKDLEHTDVMAVWFFFIPILNLVKPPTIMTEIWDKTQDSIAERQPDFIKNKNGLIGLWWFLFVVSAFLGSFVAISSQNAVTPADLNSTTIFSIITTGANMLEGAVAILLIRSVSKVEEVLEQVYQERGTSADSSEDL